LKVECPINEDICQQIQELQQKSIWALNHQGLVAHKVHISDPASPTTSHIGRYLVRDRNTPLHLQELHAIMDSLDGNGWLEDLG
jgi:hypothetical protein